MKFIKEKKLCTSEYVKKLHDWIIENQKEYFTKENEVNSEVHFRHFNQTVDRKHFCFSNEVMLIDRLVKGVHMYCICTISKNPNTARITCEIPVIEIDKLNDGMWRNGYFLLPELLPN